MGVDHRRRDVAVAEQLLDHPQILTALEEVGREAMAQGVRARRHGDPRGPERRAIGLLQVVLVEVVALDAPIERIAAQPRAGEDVLPCPIGLVLRRSPQEGVPPRPRRRGLRDADATDREGGRAAAQPRAPAAAPCDPCRPSQPGPAPCAARDRSPWSVPAGPPSGAARRHTAATRPVAPGLRSPQRTA